jgi:hypothetical protein
VTTAPRERIQAAAAALGPTAFVAGCVGLLRGDDGDPELVQALGGPGTSHVLVDATGKNRYWLRVWAARGLLWAWDPEATAALGAALDDEAWRVREMACKVVARHALDDLLDEVLALRNDPVPRVRAAASRAVVRLTQGAA